MGNKFDPADVPGFIVMLALCALVLFTVGGIVWAGVMVLFFN